jgi:hypothetical protein
MVTWAAPALFGPASSHVSHTSAVSRPNSVLCCSPTVKMPQSIDVYAFHNAYLCSHLPHAARKAASGPDHTRANWDNSFEQFILAEGEKKVEMKLDTRKFLVLVQRSGCLANFCQECPIPLFSHSIRKIIHWEIFCALDYFKIVGSHSPLTRCVSFGC